MAIQFIKALPNFIGIGTQRAGSTWLHACLQQHPQIYVPVAKELHFFNAHFDRGASWYHRQFTPAARPRYKTIGEVTPNYLDHPRAIPRMYQVVPDAKLIVILRHPVERAYSAYRFFQNRYDRLTFVQACQRGRDLVHVGLYSRHLTRLFRYYPRHQVQIFLYEQIATDPESLLTELWQFLNVDPSVRPPAAGQTFNRPVLPAAQTALSRCGLGWVVPVVKQTPLGSWLKNRARNNRPPADRPTPDDFDQITPLFREDLLRLESLINRDLSVWLTIPSKVLY